MAYESGSSTGRAGGSTFLKGNTDALAELSSDIAAKSDEIHQNIEDLYTVLNKLNSEAAWAGDNADLFLSKCLNRKSEIEKTPQFMKDYSDLVARVNGNLETLCSSVSSSCSGVK